MDDRDRDRRGSNYDRRDRYSDRDRQGRNSDRDKSKRKPENDKFKDSLSEGLKHDKDSSSDSEAPDIDIDDVDEDQIIERRRKQREELMKKLGAGSEDSNTMPSETSTPANFKQIDDDVIFVQLPKKVLEEKKMVDIDVKGKYRTFW